MEEVEQQGRSVLELLRKRNTQIHVISFISSFLVSEHRNHSIMKAVLKFLFLLWGARSDPWGGLSDDTRPAFMEVFYQLTHLCVVNLWLDAAADHHSCVSVLLPNFIFCLFVWFIINSKYKSGSVRDWIWASVRTDENQSYFPQIGLYLN